MRITIEETPYAPKWETLQEIIREATADDSATLVRLNRKDNGCDYLRPGEYELGVRDQYGDVKAVELNVTGFSPGCPKRKEG